MGHYNIIIIIILCFISISQIIDSAEEPFSSPSVRHTADSVSQPEEHDDTLTWSHSVTTAEPYDNDAFYHSTCSDPSIFY
ncbi:hypothetical protein EYF80_059227 [Liparis tanakae]|uniref:Uncharacterized protein n=1 Tax=Liparis tanakae TaxID=230148 RepID=A0A4Z2EPY8_9TELE|nr:hypothetical protein EYF80_059227 [Liparis tanakae]